jgi:hypothetical protein
MQIHADSKNSIHSEKLLMIWKTKWVFNFYRKCPYYMVDSSYLMEKTAKKSYKSYSECQRCILFSKAQIDSNLDSPLKFKLGLCKTIN